MAGSPGAAGAEPPRLIRAVAIVPAAGSAERFGGRKLLTLIDAGEGGAPIAQPQPLFPRLVLEEEPEAAA